MQSIDLSGFDKFTADIEKALKDSPKMRKKLHEEIADTLKQEIDSNISSSLNDSNGRIRNWQEKYVGSGGGYAAVRAAKGSGKDSAGAITNYLESGHKIRSRKSQGKYYYPKINVAYVDGAHFYANTRNTIETKIIGLVENFADELAQKIGG